MGRLRSVTRLRHGVDAFPDRMFRACADPEISEVVQNVVTYTAIVSAPNPERFSGMTAVLRIVISDTGETLKIHQALRSGLPVRAAENNTARRAGGSTVW